ncbi:hypothetical protein MNSC_04180 [Minisyncoccus archaeophilus]|uniref:glycine-rich domain-containing protein n=1 Tax=Minisyncoccus archaeiphilus TaxID=3238481 RepID=UPI00399CC837
MLRKSFTLIELLVIIAIIAILAAFIIANLGSSRSLAQDAVRKNDISNLYKSIVGKNALSESSYPDIVSTIEPGKTNSNLQSFIDQFLKTTPYDPNPTKAYLYKGNGKDFSIAAILDDGSCFIKSTGLNLFGSDTICSTYNEGGIGLVQNFMFLHGSTYLDLIWSIPTSLSSLPTSNVSSAIICLDSASELDPNSLPSDEYLFTHGTIITLVNNAVNEYRITLDNPDYYYYCKTYSYDNTVITNPGVPGSSPNTSTGGFSSSSSSSYSSSSPSTYTPGASSNPPSIGGSTTTGGSTSPSFNLEPIRNPDGTGSITLSWIPGYLSTHTLIRRDYNTPPETRTDGTSIYYERNDKDNQDITSIHYHTDTGLSEDYIYCYSAWAYDERTNTYSNGFVLACGGVPPSNPTNLTMTSTTNSFNLNWTKGSSTNTVIRRSINTPPQNQEQGTLVYNSTSSSFTDTDITLTKNTTYCYSIWSYNPTTASLSTEYLSSCGTLSNMATPTNLSFPTVAYNSIILNWTPGTGSTNTLIVRKQGSIPTSRTDGTTIYEDNGNAFIDTGLTDNTEYCYALYATDGTEYTEALTGCQTTQAITGLVSHWKFDEGTGTTAYDSAGTNHGTLTNGPTWKTSSDCISGGCLQFDGSNDYVNIGTPSSLEITQSISILAWVKGNGTAISRYQHDNTHRSWTMNFSPNSIYVDIMKDCNATSNYKRYGYTNTSLETDTSNWHHIAFTYSTTDDALRVYLDGLDITHLEYRDRDNILSSICSNTTEPIRIGSQYYNNALYSLYNGLIDEVRIYNKALTSAEVSSLYETDEYLLNIKNGACGSINGTRVYSTPTEELCAYGYPGPVLGDGPWAWSCIGEYASVSCSTVIGCTQGEKVLCKESLDGDYVINKYTLLQNNLSSTVDWVVPPDVAELDLLVVGGGGGGGNGANNDNSRGGGGGAGGGLIYLENHIVPSNNIIPIAIGSGGLGSNRTSDSVPVSGGNSSFGEFVALGGGAGGMTQRGNYLSTGSNGGSGGGGGSEASAYSSYIIGGNALQPTSISGGYGNKGGTAQVNGVGGGGGGASGVGNNGSAGGLGGAGMDIRGVLYAKGGNGGKYPITATDAPHHTGNGGQGGRPNSTGGSSIFGGNGGSGVVVIRYHNPLR